MRVLDYVLDMSAACGGFFSIENPCTKASGSEIRRWIKQRAVLINGHAYTDAQAQLELPVQSFVLFPKSKSRRCTIL